MDDLIVTCSVFDNAWSIDAGFYRNTWKELCRNLSKRYPVDPTKDPKEAKKAIKAFSAATFVPYTTRCNKNVHHMDLIVFDFDNNKEVNLTMKEVTDQLTSMGLCFFAYFTFSSTMAYQKFRIVLPLSKSLYADFDGEMDWDTFTEWALDRLNFNKWRDCIDVEKHLKDASRINFLQGNPVPENMGEIKGEGQPLEWSVDEVNKFLVKNPVLKQQIKVYWASNNNFTWMKTYNLDWGTLDLPGLFMAKGLWIGTARETSRGTRYECACPWAYEHNHQNQGTASIIKSNGRAPGFNCFHTHTQRRGLKDIIELFSIEELSRFAKENNKTKLI